MSLILSALVILKKLVPNTFPLSIYLFILRTEIPILFFPSIFCQTNGDPPLYLGTGPP